jgi:hypothetical protein
VGSTHCAAVFHKLVDRDLDGRDIAGEHPQPEIPHLFAGLQEIQDIQRIVSGLGMILRFGIVHEIQPFLLRIRIRRQEAAFEHGDFGGRAFERQVQ